MRRCPRCGEENPDRFRLCGFCGQQLAPPDAAAPEVRKTVSIVFCDLKGSTALGERLDSEALRELLGRYFEIMRAILERHGGTVEKYIGDAIMAVFGIPRLHEDDALRAVRAAAEMRTALAELNAELERRWGARLANRTGVNTGEVVAGDVSLGQRLVTGDAVNVAARLEQAAPESDVLIGHSTYRLVRDAVEVVEVEPLTLKGKSEPVPAYRLISVRSGEWFERNLEAPLVGRAGELTVLLSAFGRAVEERRIAAATVVAHAGMGKTRLSQEFTHRIGPDVLVLRGRCLSYGEGMTFWPLAEMIAQASGASGTDPAATAQEKLRALVSDAEVADRLSSVVGLSDRVFPLQETHWASRRFVEILAERTPLLLVFDDIHWAEPTLLDLIENIIASTSSARAFVLCMARHELFDEHPRFLASRPNATRIDLARLTNADSAAIIDNLLEHAALPESVRERVIANAEGNPLYVEQTLSMLLDDGVLSRDDKGGWRTDPMKAATVEIPPTVTALIGARVDRLGHEERGVMETGSIAGLTFYEDAVAELRPSSTREELATQLASLGGKDLIRDEPSNVPNVRAFRFAHALIREATYGRLLRRVRADLHERFARWLERVTRARPLEYEELVGYHLEQATVSLEGLGPATDHSRGLAIDASTRLASAGARASARGDMPASANLLQRAMALREASDRVRLELAADLTDARREMGDFKEAAAVIASALEAAPSDAEDLRASLRLAQLLVERSMGIAGWVETARRESERAAEIFERTKDHAGLARAYRILATIHGLACRYAEALRASERAVDEARLCGDTRQETRTLPNLALCALFGPEPVESAIALCDQLALRTPDDRRSLSGVRYARAQLYAMRGDFEQARADYREARRTLDDLGDRRLAAFTALFAGRVELLAGEPVAAEEALRPPYEALHAAGERNFVPTAAAILAEAVYQQDRSDEALELSRVSEALASPSDVESQYRWRSIRAKVMAQHGDIDGAMSLIDAARALVESTDAPAMQADVLMDLATVREFAGDSDGAAAAWARAFELYHAKGDVASFSARSSRAISRSVA